MTFGSLAGELTALKYALPSHVTWAEPWSPVEAKTVIPWPAIRWKSRCVLSSSFGSMHCSASPKLCETTSPRLWSETYFCALKMSSSLFDFATTRSIVAPGAIAWAHSTSSVVSPFQPKRFPGVVADGGPSGWMMFNVEAGIPK